MIDSVPLIQNPNDAQQINASIIAMKRASKELDEKILKLSTLNSELDKKIALLDSGLNKEIEDRKEAINSLDVSSVGGSGKYISAISETDGKISATVSDLTSVIESGNNQPATSGGVAGAIQGVISLPTDAVLHYSFDEVPDLPDGTATYKKDNDFSTTSGWQSPDDVTVTLVDNCIKLQSDGTRAQIFARNNIFTTNNLKGKVVMVKFTSTFSVSSVGFQVQISPWPWYYLTKVKQNGNEYLYVGYIPSDMLSGSPFIGFRASSASADNAVTISAIYIGDGSYSTQIIDNANGQNNSVSAQGFVANKGVSGKGITFYNGDKKTIRVKWDSSNWDRAYTVSCWIKVNNSSIAIIGWDTGYGVQNHYLRYNNNNKYIWFDVNENTRVIAYICDVDLDDGKWHNIVAINKFESGKSEIWVDGEKKALTTQNRVIVTTENYFLVGSSRAATNYYDSTNSQLDDFQLFDRALTDTEVMALYLNKANTPKYYSWADWKLNQMENANRSIVAETRNIEEPPIEESGEEER